jgi:hypothetical protein
MPNEIYHKSNWGNANAEGFGDVYFDAAATNKLYNHSDYYENSDGTDKILRDIPNKASITLTPTAYSDGSINTVIPTDGNGDFDFSRGSSATRVNEKGLIESIASGLPRIDYSSGFGSLLLEPQRTNLLTYSEDFSQTFWKKGAGLTITLNNAVSPDGSQTATKIQKTSQDYLFLRAFFAPAIVGTLSVFIKKGNYRYVGIRNNETAGTTHSVFDFDTETFVTTASNHSLSFVKHENGWYRLIDYVSVDDNSNYQGIAITDVLGNEISTDIPLNSYVYVWGAQYEQNQSYPTSYIPTNGSSVTRSADAATGAGTSDTFNDSEGVLFAEISALVNDTTNTTKAITISQASNNLLGFYYYESRIDAYVRVNGVNQFLKTHYLDPTINNKISLKYKTNDFALWINGFEIDTDTNGTIPSGLNQLRFDDFSDKFYGKTKELAVFKEALTDAELENLTSWVSFTEMATDLEYTLE